MPKISTLNSVYPTDCAVLQQLRAECSAYSYFLNSGYINYYIDDTFKPYEHRLVAEMAYGAIPNGYQVHHINGIRSDNRAINLQVLSNRDHQHLHCPPSGHMAICPVCLDSFYVRQVRDAIKARQNYCSRKCLSMSQRKAQRPTPEELSKQIQEIGNWSAIGRLYGVSDNAIRKWARAYGLLAAR